MGGLKKSDKDEVAFTIGEGREREDITNETVDRLREEHEIIDRVLGKKIDKNDKYTFENTNIEGYIEKYSFAGIKNELKMYKTGDGDDYTTIALVYRDGSHVYLEFGDFDKIKFTGLVGAYISDGYRQAIGGRGLKIVNYGESYRGFNLDWGSDWRVDFADDPKAKIYREKVPQFESAIEKRIQKQAQKATKKTTKKKK